MQFFCLSRLALNQLLTWLLKVFCFKIRIKSSFLKDDLYEHLCCLSVILGTGKGPWWCLFFFPVKYLLAKGCPKGLECLHLLKAKNSCLTGAEASCKHYSLCVSNCKVDNIHTLVLIPFTRTSLS